MKSGGSDWIFYDGSCGLCHGAVKFVLAHDRRGVFHFAPLDGPTYRQHVGGHAGETVVVVTSGGDILRRSDAAAYALNRLGGGWAYLGAMLRFLPKPIRDAAYMVIARFRRRLFRDPEGVCPRVPAHLAARFHP